MPTINDSVQFLKGVGPAFAKKFEKLGILTIRDLLLCYPRKYIDYTQPYTVVSAPYDVECCVRATVLQKEPARRVKGGRVMNRVLAADDSGILALSWFNAPYAADKLEVGETYYFEGRIGGKSIWFDTDVQRLNEDGRGMLLGEFSGNDKIIAVFKNGTYYTTSYDLSNRYQGDLLLIEKYDENKVYAALYYDGENFYIKRFSFPPSDNCPRQFSCIVHRGQQGRIPC